MDEKLMLCGKPADFSFNKLRVIDVPKFLDTIGLEGARFTRTGSTPQRGNDKKYLTRSIWLDNNKLKSIKHCDELVEALLEYPNELGWIDFSFNFITEIDQCITKFQQLKILYFHGNCIADLDQVWKLRPLKQLHTVTFKGNPISNHTHYRRYVLAILPQLKNLDFVPIGRNEKMAPVPAEVAKKLKEEKRNS